jgi:hypothetical protein
MKYLTVLFCLISTIYALGENILPNPGFELDLTFRDYQLNRFMTPNGSILKGIGKGEKCIFYSSDADSGMRSLGLKGFKYTNGKLSLTSRTFFAPPGKYTFSFSIKLKQGHSVKSIVSIQSNPFLCGKPLKSFRKKFNIESNNWQRIAFSFELPKSKDNWRWLNFTFYGKADSEIQLDSLKMVKGDDSIFTAGRNIEMNLSVAGPWFRIFKKGKKLPPLEINAINYTDSLVSKQIEIEIKDFNNNQVFKKKTKLDIPPKGRMDAKIPIEINSQGAFRAELYIEGGNIQDELIFAVLPEIKDPVLATQYGMPTPEMNKALGVAYGGHHGHGKWCYIEKEAGHYNWKTTDIIYNQMKGAYREVCQTMVYAPPKWQYSKKNKKHPYPPSAKPERQFDLDDYLTFLEKYCRRYPDYKYIQPWNEPWTWKPEEFVEFLKECRNTLNKINPKIKILAPTTFPMQHDWMNGFIKAGGLKYTDILALHAYPAGGGYLPETLAICKKWATADGKKDRPLWDTEIALQPFNTMSWLVTQVPANIGSYTNKAMVPDAHAAEEGVERWTKLYLTQTAMGITRFFPHVAPLYSSRLPRPCDLRQAEPDCSRHPMGIALSVAAMIIGNSQALGSPQINSNLRVMMFRQGNTLQAAIWTREYEALEITDPIKANLYRSKNEADKNRGVYRKIINRPIHQYLLAVNPNNIKAFSLFGNPIPLKTQNGMVAVPISCRPVYLEFNNIDEERLYSIMRNSKIVGLRNFLAKSAFGSTSKGFGIITGVSSCAHKKISISGKCRSLNEYFILENSSVKQTIMPGKTRYLDFTFKSFPPIANGLRGFKLFINSEDSSTSMDIKHIWLLGAFKRDDIKLDGNLSEWNKLPGIKLGQRKQAVRGKMKWQGVRDSSAIIKAAWNKDNLFFAYDVYDDELTKYRSWSGDCIELFFDVDYIGDRENSGFSSDDLQVFTNPPITDKWPIGSVVAYKKLEGAQLVAKRTNYGYTAELVIPMKNFIKYGFYPTANNAMGFNATVCDRDSDGWSKLVWNAQSNIHMDTSKFGTLVLLKVPNAENIPFSVNDNNIVAEWQFDSQTELIGKGPDSEDAVVTDAKLIKTSKENFLEFNGKTSTVVVRKCNIELQCKRFRMLLKCAAGVSREQLLWREDIAPGWQYSCKINKDGKLVFRLIEINNVAAEAVGKTNIRDSGKWHSVGYDWDDSKMSLKLFVDGKPESEIKLKIQPEIHALSFGGSTNDNLFFKGQIKKVSISDLNKEIIK